MDGLTSWYNFYLVCVWFAVYKAPNVLSHFPNPKMEKEVYWWIGKDVGYVRLNVFTKTA